MHSKEIAAHLLRISLDCISPYYRLHFSLVHLVYKRSCTPHTKPDRDRNWRVLSEKLIAKAKSDKWQVCLLTPLNKQKQNRWKGTYRVIVRKGCSAWVIVKMKSTLLKVIFKFCTSSKLFKSISFKCFRTFVKCFFCIKTKPQVSQWQKMINFWSLHPIILRYTAKTCTRERPRKERKQKQEDLETSAQCIIHKLQLKYVLNFIGVIWRAFYDLDFEQRFMAFGLVARLIVFYCDKASNRINLIF